MHPPLPSCQVSDTSSPFERVALPGLRAVVAARPGLSLSMVADALGISRQHLHRRIEGTFARAEAEAVATYLAVPLATLQRAAPAVAPSVQDHPTITALATAAADEVTDRLLRLATDVAAATATLIATGAVPTPVASPPPSPARRAALQAHHGKAPAKSRRTR